MTIREAIQQGMREFMANLDTVRGDIDQQLADVDLGAAGVDFTDSSNARVIGVYGGYAPGRAWFGGEVQVLYAYDQVTGEAGAYLYTGGSLGPSVGASAIGGVFLFDGPIEKIIGPTVGVQGASGVAVGVSTTLDLNPYFMVQIGAELGVSAEITLGWTFDVNSDAPRIDWETTEATLNRLYGESPELLQPMLAELVMARSIPAFQDDFIETYGELIHYSASRAATNRVLSQPEVDRPAPHEFLPGVTTDMQVTHQWGTNEYSYNDPETGLRLTTYTAFDPEIGQFATVTKVLPNTNAPTGAATDLLIGNVYAAGNVGVGQELNALDQIALQNQLSYVEASQFESRASSVGLSYGPEFSFGTTSSDFFTGPAAPLRFSDDLTGGSTASEFLLFTPDTTFEADIFGTWMNSGSGVNLSFGDLVSDWDPQDLWRGNPDLGFDLGTPVGGAFDDASLGLSPYFQTHASVGTSLSFMGGARNHVSPLVIDLDGDGVAADLRHIYDDGIVFFDIDADGFAERVGWTGPDDGQLAMDRNGNGMIDDITELYGDDEMPAFDKLRLHDSNADGVLDAQDADFGALLVWQDLNQDGISQAGELRSLAAHDIVSINLNDQADDRFVKENYISHVSTVTFAGGLRSGNPYLQP